MSKHCCNRFTELEQKLAAADAEIARMRPVVTAARAWVGARERLKSFKCADSEFASAYTESGITLTGLIEAVLEWEGVAK